MSTSWPKAVGNQDLNPGSAGSRAHSRKCCGKQGTIKSTVSTAQKEKSKDVDRLRTSQESTQLARDSDLDLSDS